MNQRKTYFSLTIVWTGFVFVITSMMAGGGLAAGMDFKHIILATLGGNIFLSIIAVLISIIACKTGLTFALLTRYSFGSSGSKAASIFVPVVNLGWYTIQAATYGHFVAQVFHMGQVGEGLCMAASAIIMGIFAMFGISAITILGYIAIPAIVFLSIATAIRSLGVIGGVDALFSYLPAANMPLFTGITAVIGTWVLSTATCIADIMRYAKDTKTAISATLTGLLGGNILMIVCGAIAAIALTIFALTYTPAPDTGDDALPTGENVSMDGMDGMDGMEGTDGEIPEEESTDGETTDEESTEEETTGETEEESSTAASDSTGNAGTSVSVGGGVMISGGGTAIAVPMG